MRSFARHQQLIKCDQCGIHLLRVTGGMTFIKVAGKLGYGSVFYISHFLFTPSL
jgi:hypothetical protein